MTPRTPDEEHRAATPLELFFDLVFVVAIAQAAGRFHHAIASAHVADGILSYVMVFFAIWWAWMNFTWFASAYDPDDVPYRLVVLLQLVGALILAAGVATAFDERDFRLVAGGYVVMRVAMIVQWRRAGRADPERRATAWRYAVGIAACQAAWVGLMFRPESWLLPGFVALVIAELLVPVWAERAAVTPWHREHIAERYGLFTIIVLGESILAASVAFQAATTGGAAFGEIARTAIGSVLIVFSLWWLYFARTSHDLLVSARAAFLWGDGHYVIFAAAAAIGAGIAVNIDLETGHAAIGEVGAGAAVAIPVALYLLGMWAMHGHPRRVGWAHATLGPVFAGLVLLTPWSPEPVLLTGLLTASLLALVLVTRRRP